jgi:hypothetical protein
VLLLTGVLVMSVGIPLVLAISTGSIAIPHNDAWSHSRIAQNFATTGRIELLGWNRTALAGQVVILGPLGKSIVAQQLLVVGLSLVALTATYLYLRARMSGGRALLGTAIVGAIPEFGLLSTSYMSDLPAFAGMMVCLTMADRAFRSRSPVWLIAAASIGVWAFTVREQALAAPAAVVLAAVWTWRGRQRLRAIGLGAAVVTAAVIFEIWRRSLPFGDSPMLNFDPGHMLTTASRASFTMALYLAPAVFLVARPTQWSPRVKAFAVTVLAAALACASLTWHIAGSVFLGNYLDRHGAYAAAAMGIRDVLPSIVWMALLIIAFASLWLLTGTVLDAGLRIDRVSLLLGALLVVGTLAQAAVGQDVFGRYLLPLIPIALVPLLNAPRQRHCRLALLTLATLALTSLAVTANALAFDAARWHAAQGVQASGTPATHIDPGLEWVGYHAAGPARPGNPRSDAGSWYFDLFPDSRQCVSISASPLIGQHPTATYPYRRYAVLGHARLWIYSRVPCG